MCIIPTKRCEDVSQFGGVDEALALAIECLERLHEVGERARLGRFIRLLVHRQDLLELVLLLACVRTTSYNRLS